LSSTIFRRELGNMHRYWNMSYMKTKGTSQMRLHEAVMGTAIHPSLPCLTSARSLLRFATARSCTRV
jgi:hypothetical protein